MSVSNGAAANAATFNGAFVSKTANSTTIGQLTLNNADSSSGSQVTNIQRELNAFSSYTGKTLNVVFDALPSWSNNDIGASTDSLFDRIEAIQAEFPVDLTAQVTNVLPLANGGTGKSSFSSNQIVFGQLEQASTFIWDGSRLGVNVASPSASFDLDGTLSLREASAAIEYAPAWASGVGASAADYGIDPGGNAFVRITERSPSGDFLRAIRPPAASGSNDFLFIANATTADITAVDRTSFYPAGEYVIKTGGAADVVIKAGSLAAAAYDQTDRCWRLLGGGGGGGANVENIVIDSVDEEATDSYFQYFTNTVSPDSYTLNSIDLTLAPDFAEITFSCTKSTGTMTITTAASGVEFMAGDFVGTYGDSITFVNTPVIGGLVEKCRSINNP